MSNRVRRFALWWLVVVCLLVALAAWISTARAAPSEPTKRVIFHGYKVEVPASWPVVDLARNPSACVRFDVHAVYLGHPGPSQSCPAHLVGRTEALLVEPLDKASKARVRGDTTWAPKGMAAATIPAPTDHEVTVGVTQAGVLVTGSYGDDRATLAEVIGGATLTQEAQPATELAPSASAAESVVLPGTFNGKGFDACSAPSSSDMQTWLASSPYRAANIYIGGVNRGCDDQPNLTPAWVSEQHSAGWALVPTYVGLQAPCATNAGLAKIDPANAAAQGRQEAEDAVVQAGALGIGAGSVIYFDMEGYPNNDPACSQTVLTYLSNWSTRLHELRYLSGVYSSVGSGIRDLVSVYDSTAFVRPDHIWFAHWGTAANTSDPAIPETVWPNHQRIKQYQGGHNERWPDIASGVTINIDNDFLDVVTPEPPPPPPPVEDASQDGPAAVTVGSEIHLFARGVDKRLYEAFFRSGRWSTWAPLGTLTVAGSPSVIRYSTGLNLYARGTDGRLYETYLRSGGSWSNWVAHGGLTVAGDPAATTDGTTINIFSQGADQRLYELSFAPATRWSSWVAHPGVTLGGNPVAVRLGSELHVFARGADAGLYETFYRSGFGWSNWTPHAGRTVAGDPTAVTYSTGINLFARGADGRLYETYLRSGKGWSSWVAHGGATLDGDPAALVLGTEIHVFARTTSNVMAELAYRSGWKPWASHGGVAIAGTPAAVVYGSGGINAYARGADNHLWETYFRPTGGWSSWHVRGGTAVAIA